MEDVLSLLKSYTEPWLSFSSEYLGAVPSFILLNVVGLLMLYLCYLLLPTKHPERATKKRKGGTFRGWRSHKREAEERKKLLNILKRPLGHHHDNTYFRHMLCPDPSCEVCNRTTAEIQQLLSQESLQDAALSEYFSSSADSMIETSVCFSSDFSTIPPGNATAFPLAEPSPPPCSTVSTNLESSFEDFISLSNLGDSLPPELTPCLDFSSPGRHVLLQPPGIPTPPPKTKDMHSTNLAALEIWNQAHTKDLPTSNLAQGDAKKNILALHSSKASSGVAPAFELPGIGNLFFLSSDALALLERQVRKKGDFLIHRENEKKKVYFPKQLRPDLPLPSPGKALGSIHDKYDSAVSLPFWNGKDKPRKLRMHQKSPYPKIFEQQLSEKCIQISGDHLALYHNFLYPAGPVSGSCSSTLLVLSSTYDTSTAQESPAVSNAQSQQSTAVSTLQSQESTAVSTLQSQQSTAVSTLQSQESTAVSNLQSQESPAISNPQSQESPVFPTTQAQESTALSVTQANESPVLPATQAQESPVLPATQAQESPALPATQVNESPALNTTIAQESPVLPTTQAQEFPAFPITQAKESPALLATQAQESPVLPATQAQESPALPVIQAQESPALPVTQAQETPMLPATQAQETSALPATQAQETSVLPATQVQESPVLPATQVQESPALPITQANESPALTTTHAQESPVLLATQAQESPELPITQANKSPALTTTQAQESPVLPVTIAQESPVLPVTQALETQAVPDPLSQKPSILPNVHVQQSLALPNLQFVSEFGIQSQTQFLTKDQLQSCLPMVSFSAAPQNTTCGVHFPQLQKEVESLNLSETQHLEHHLVKKKQENLWGIPSVVLESQKVFCPPAPNLSLLSQSCKDHIPVSILPGEFSLNSEIREKLEHHLRKRLVQYQCGLPHRVCESLSLVSIQSDISGTSESKSNQGLSGICLLKDQSIRDTVDLKLRPPGSFCEKILGMLLPEKGERMVSLSGNNSRTSWMSLNQQKCKNALETHLKRKVMEIKENHIPRIVYNSLHSVKHSWASEKPCSQEHQDLAKVISVASNIDTSCQLDFLGPSKQKMLEDHIQNYHDRITWGLPEKVLEITELFKMKENSQAGVSRPCTQSSMFLHGDKVRRISVPSSDRHSSAISPICKPYREGSVALHEDKARTRTSVPSLNRHFSATSAVCKRYKGDSTTLHGDKARTRISVSSPDRHFSATSPICKPYRESSVALHERNAWKPRTSVPSLNRHVSATTPICKPYRESSMALYEHNAKPRTSVPSLNRHVSATSPICKPYRESSMALHEDKARTRTSVPSLNRHVSATSAVCKPCKGDSTALHEDKKRTRMPVPSVEHPFHVTSALHKLSNKRGPIALHGDKERAIISVPGVDYQLPSTSLVIKVRQGAPRQTPCDSLPEQEGNIKRFNNPKQHSLPCTDGITEKAWHKQSELANRCSPMVFTKQFLTGSKPCYNKWSSRNRIKRLQSKKLNNLEHFPMLNKSRKIFISRELCALPSPHRSILTTNKSEISPMTNVSLSKVGNTISIKYLPAIISESTDTKLSGLSELKVVLKNRECNQDYNHLTDQTLASRNLKSKPDLTHAQGICTWNMAPSQVLHVHSDSTGRSRQQMQEPCVPLCGLQKGQQERFLPAVKRTNPPEPKPEELGGGDAGLSPSQPRKRIHAARDEMPKDTCGRKSSPVQSQRGQLPAENHFRKQVKHFLQWIWPSRKCDGPESFLKNGNSLLSMQGINLVKNQTTFTWDTKLQQVRTAGGNVPEEKRGHDHGIGKKCHQESLSSQMKSGKTQHKAELQIGAVPVQGCPFNQRATSCNVTNTTSCHQGAAFAGQSYPTRNIHVRPRGRAPQKTVLFRDQHGTRSIL